MILSKIILINKMADICESKVTENFYEYTIRNLSNFRLYFIKIGDVFLRKLKSGTITQEQYNEKKIEGIKKIEKIKREYIKYLKFVEETDKYSIFKITNYFRDILRGILNNPDNFLSYNPRFKKYKLNNIQIQKIIKILKKPLLNARYNKKDKNGIFCLDNLNEIFKEAHIDEDYETLHSSNEDIWGLTIIKDENGCILDNVNGGTEFIEVPILKNEVIQELIDHDNENINSFFPYKCMIGNKEASCTAKTLPSIILSTLTSAYVNENKTYWKSCEVNCLHNVATCYYHRSCKTLKPERPIERIHWAYDETDELREVIDKL